MTPIGLNQLHRAFVELQHAICTLDALTHNVHSSSSDRATLSAYVKELESIAARLEQTENGMRIALNTADA